MPRGGETGTRASAAPSEDDYDMVVLEGTRSPERAHGLSTGLVAGHVASAGTAGDESQDMPDNEVPAAVDGSQEMPDDVVSVCSSDLATMVLASSIAAPIAHRPPLSTVQEDDEQAISQTAPRMPGRKRDIHVKFMLLGESGLGKTTLAKQLLQSYVNGGAAINLPGHDGTSTSMEQFKKDPESLCTVLDPVPIPDQNLRLLLKIQDMPGWGDDINLRRYLEAVMEFILQQRAADYREFKGNNALPTDCMAGCLKNSITACLYFLPPHRVKQVDLIMMSALSQHVVLIPVIAKADTMTVSETAKYRQEILDRCLNPNSYITRSNSNMPEITMNFFRFEENNLTALGVQHDVPPFTLITSEQLDEAGRPVRRYLWGDCNAADRTHSDFILLKRLLLGDKVDSLWDLLFDSVGRYKQFCTDYEALGQRLGVMVETSCAVCGPHLEYDDYLKSKTQVKQLQDDKQQLQDDKQQLQLKAAESQAQVKQLQGDLGQLQLLGAGSMLLNIILLVRCLILFFLKL